MSNFSNQQADEKATPLRKLRHRADSTLGGRALSLDREKLEFWLMFRPESLRESLELFAIDGAAEVLPAAVQVTPFHRVGGYSGYQYRIGSDCHAEVGFAPLQYGGFTIHKLFQDSQGKQEVWEIYSGDGKLVSVDGALFLSLLFVDLAEMHPAPILSHLYNYLAHEYAQAQFGQACSSQIALIERFVRAVGAPPAHRDPAVTGIWLRMLQAEADLNLNWEERQKVIEGLLAERERAVRTKARAHGYAAWTSIPLIKAGDWINRGRRLAMRPGSIIQGFTYKYTIGLLIWFFQTVRGNIGYSMALAIYGPFTFYFITQPLNPHAMWAVGHVRSAYLEASERLKGLAGPAAAGTEQSPSQSQSPSPAAQSQTGAPASGAVPPPAPWNKHLGLPLSTDFNEVDEQNWADRMSNFKNMQIGYEQNMQFAARMGRLEQMETQLNFPLIADNAWDETERYVDQLQGLLRGAPAPELHKYLQEEERGARRIQLYVWDRLLRFVLDHPYVLMDQSKEQTYRDYYSGHAFTLLKAMTETLAKLHPDFKRPAEFKRIEALAAAFQKSHVEAPGILARLRGNAKLFGQKDRFDGQELRSYMKREWETLYLLQNKAQEASNFGLMSYTWSVRNTLWLMQSLYSAKRRELSLLLPGHPLAPEEAAKARAELARSIEPMYESIFHMLNLEFVSLRPELTEKLSQDIEYRQRHAVIETVEQFIAGRDALVKAALK